MCYYINHKIKESIMKKISVIIPMYYEEEVAEKCYEKVTETLKIMIMK